MPVICMVQGREQQALPVFLLVTLFHTDAGIVQGLQRIQEEPDIESQGCQGNRRNVVDPNMEHLREQHEESNVDSS